jgi:hypothetical protein
LNVGLSLEILLVQTKEEGDTWLSIVMAGKLCGQSPQEPEKSTSFM